MRADTRVAVIVPNWNGEEFLDATLRSVREQTRSAQQVVVVDNASTDGSVAMLARSFPEVRVVRLRRNRGFGAAANAGIDTVDTELVAVLNSDARPRRDWLERLLAQPDDAGVWAWGSVQVTADGTVESAGDHYDPAGFAYRLGRGMALDRLPQAPYDVFSPPGACPLFRRDVVLALGGYEERFFLYYEDVDLAFRARLAGYRAVVVPDAVVEHDQGRSSGRGNRMWFYVGRNSLWCAVRNQPQVQVRGLLRRTGRELRIARERGGTTAYVAGRAAGIAGLGWALRSRGRLRAVHAGAAAPFVSVPAFVTTGSSPR